MRTQFFREGCFVGSSSDRNGPKAHPLRELHAEMAEAADSLDGDQITCAQTRVAQAIVGGHPRAEQRRSLDGRDSVRDLGDGSGLGNNDFRVTAVDRDARDDGTKALRKIAAAAGLARTVLSAKEAESDTLTDFPAHDIGPERVDPPNNLMARHAGVRNPRELSLYSGDI
jgi:hypothetical protein